MNTIRKLIRFLLGIVLFGCFVWGVVELISTGDMVASTPYLVPVFVVYFMFDVIIRITDLEKWVKEHAKIGEPWIVEITTTVSPSMAKSKPKPETEKTEGKETT